MLYKLSDTDALGRPCSSPPIRSATRQATKAVVIRTLFARGGSSASRGSYFALTVQQAVAFLALAVCGTWVWFGHQKDTRAAIESVRRDDADALAQSTAVVEALGGYLSLLKAASNDSVFFSAASVEANALLDATLSGSEATRLANANALGNYLSEPKGSPSRFTAKPRDEQPYLSVWQLTRGLPLRLNGRPVDKPRRDRLNALLDATSSMVLVAQVGRANEVVMAAPYSSQLALPTRRLDNLVPNIDIARRTHHPSLSTFSSLLGQSGRFMAVVVPIDSSHGQDQLLAAVVRRPSRLDEIGEFELADMQGTQLVATWRKPAPVSPSRRVIAVAGERYLLLTRSAAPVASTFAAERLALMGLTSLILLVIQTREFGLILRALDAMEERSRADTEALQVRLDQTRANLQRKAERLTHDLRNRAGSLRSLQSSILAKLTHDQTKRIDGLITDIDTYARDLTHRLIGEALGYSPSHSSRTATYLRGSLDTISKQLVVGGNTRLKWDFHGDTKERPPFVELPVSDLNRILSNVLSNAVEACGAVTEPVVLISLRRTSEARVVVSVTDNGCGIPKHLQGEIFKDDFTTKGESGHGKGLPSARERASLVGGDVRLASSEPGVGTTIEIELPATETPRWFVDEFNIDNTSVIVIVDDEDMVFEYWQKTINDRFAFTLVGAQKPDIYHLKRLGDLRVHEADLARRATHLLVDQTFDKEMQTGLELIEELGLQERATLVTNAFESQTVIQEAVRLNIPILPKPYVLNARININVGVQGNA